MNDTPSNTIRNSRAAGGDEPSGPLAGQRLAEARRANDISIADIAKELHLDESKVQALEENQFEVLGAPVFAKGHLRKYAELVDVPVDDMLADYYALNRSVGPPPVVGPRKRKRRRNISLGPWAVAGLLLVVLAAAFYWWIGSMRKAGEVTISAPGVLQPFASDRNTADPDSAGVPLSANDTAVDAASGTTRSVDEASLPAATTADLETAADEFLEGVRLVLVFSGECWTEVTDANGKRLYFGLGKAGQTVIRRGMPPMHALFGQSSNVSVSVDGVDFPIPVASRRGRTARVTIGAE